MATISYLYPAFDPSLKANGSGDLHSLRLRVEWFDHSKTEVVRSSSLSWMQKSLSSSLSFVYDDQM